MEGFVEEVGLLFGCLRLQILFQQEDSGHGWH